MYVPFPYDFIYGWKEKYGITLSKEAQDELIDMMERVSRP